MRSGSAKQPLLTAQRSAAARRVSRLYGDERIGDQTLPFRVLAQRSQRAAARGVPVIGKVGVDSPVFREAQLISDKRLHARHADRLAAVEWFAVANADAFAPIGGFVAKLVEESRWLGRA